MVVWLCIAAAGPLLLARQGRTFLLRSGDSRRDERRRIAGELHDFSLQEHIVALMLLDRAEELLREGDIEEAHRAVAGARNAARAGVQAARRVMLGQQPDWVHPDLGTALCQAADQIERHHEIRVHRDVSLDAAPDHQLCVAIYRLVVEALRNAGKHARARNVELRVRVEHAWITVVVSDDGDGFARSLRVSNEFAPEMGFGMSHALEQVTALDGTYQVESAPGLGTTVRIRVPFAVCGGLGPGVGGTRT